MTLQEDPGRRDGPLRHGTAAPDAGLVRWLGACRVSDTAVLGAKVAHLADLRAAGTATPDGFAVTADAYGRAVAAAGIGPALEAAERRLGENPELAAEIAEECRALVRSLAFPEDLEAAVVAAYDELTVRRGEAYPLVAVRSSAIKEDTGEASGAGQYATVLGVSGAEAVCDAIRECWASMYSEHAALYRRHHGIRATESPMAVGIVELVDARAAGVAFSLDPVTGNPARIVVESTFGWGESLVQGHVTPDHYEIAREDGRVLRRRIATKRVISTWMPDGSGISERAMPAVLQDAASLDDAALARIVQAVLVVEKHFGYGVDVEWVWPKGAAEDPVIVQARPETVHRLTLEQLRTRPAQPFDPLGFAFAHTFTRAVAPPGQARP